MLRFRGGDTNKSRKRRKDADRRNLNDISTGHQSQFAFGNVNTGRGMVPFLTHTGNPVIQMHEYIYCIAYIFKHLINTECKNF